MIPRLIIIQYFVMGNATLMVNNLVYIWVLTFFFPVVKMRAKWISAENGGKKVLYVPPFVSERVVPLGKIKVKQKSTKEEQTFSALSHFLHFMI